MYVSIYHSSLKSQELFKRSKKLIYALHFQIDLELNMNLYPCLLSISILIAICFASIYCRMGISIVRYWAIIEPLTYSKYHNERISIYIISTCWLIGVTFGLLPLMGWYKDDSPGKCIFIDKLSSEYLLFFCFVSVIIPIIVFVVTYGLIYRVIRQKVNFELFKIN